MNIARKAGLAASVLAVLALAAPAFAQSSLAVAEAAAFMGGWTLGLDTPQGSMEMTLDLTDEGGKVGGQAGRPNPGPVPGTTAITDISKDADKLVLRYTLNFQGMEIPAEIALGSRGRQVEGRVQLRRRPVHGRRHGRPTCHLRIARVAPLGAARAFHLQQFPRRRMLRVGQHPLRRAFFHHPAIGQHDYARGEVAHEVVVVTGQQQARPVATSSRSVLPSSPPRRVERRGRLVHEQQLRIGRQRAGDGHPLRFPARQLARQRLLAMATPSSAEQRPRPGQRAAGGGAVDMHGRQADVLAAPSGAPIGSGTGTPCPPCVSTCHARRARPRRPLDGPATTRRMVVLPEPDRPISATSSPASTWRLTPRRISRVPRDSRGRCTGARALMRVGAAQRRSSRRASRPAATTSPGTSPRTARRERPSCPDSPRRSASAWSAPPRSAPRPATSP